MRLSTARQAGFTLLEIMMVVAIIMLILSSGAYLMKKQLDNAKIARVEMDLKTFQTPIMMYQSTSGVMPSSLEALVTPPSPKPPRWRKQMESLPKDPWGNDYRFRYPGTKNKPGGDGPGYDAYSVGPDGVADTADDVWLE